MSVTEPVKAEPVKSTETGAAGPTDDVTSAAGIASADSGVVDDPGVIVPGGVGGLPVPPMIVHWPWWGLAVALVAHAGLVGAMLWSPEPDAAGGGTVLDAIEVGIIDSRVLEARTEAMARAAAAAAANVQAEVGAREAQEASKAARDAAAAATARTEQALALLTTEAGALALPTAPPDMSEPKSTDAVEAASAVASNSAPSAAPSAPSPDAAQDAAAGGAQARGVEGELVPEDAGAAAPPGVVKEYALTVLQVLARNKPQPQGPVGTTRVQFTVLGDGRVVDAAVKKSSGHAVLDQAALTAIGQVLFPRPPRGLSRLETTYVLPIIFR